MSVPAAPPLARGLLLATVAVWLVAEIRQSTNRRSEGTTADRGSRPVLRIASAIAAVGAIAADQWASGAAIQPRALAAWVGLIIAWCGIALRLWSFHTLGRYFTFTVQTSDDQPVITRGPYRVIRHPSYAGILLTVVGLGVYIANWVALVWLAAAMVVGIVYRIRVEDRALLDGLGPSYRAYAATHKRLGPFIW